MGCSRTFPPARPPCQTINLATSCCRDTLSGTLHALGNVANACLTLSGSPSVPRRSKIARARVRYVARLREVPLLLVQPAVASVGQRQLVLGVDLLEDGDALLEVGCGQRLCDLGRIGGQGDLAQGAGARSRGGTSSHSARQCPGCSSKVRVACVVLPGQPIAFAEEQRQGLAPDTVGGPLNRDPLGQDLHPSPGLAGPAPGPGQRTLRPRFVRRRWGFLDGQLPIVDRPHQVTLGGIGPREDPGREGDHPVVANSSPMRSTLCPSSTASSQRPSHE